MSYFVVSNLQDLTITNSQEVENNTFFGSIKLGFRTQGSFNSLKYTKNNFTLYILGNPIVKKSFCNFIEALEFNKLLVDRSICMDVFNQLNGITSLLLLNEQENQLTIFTDPMGFFPIFLIENEEGFLITNELKQIHNYGSLQMEWDLDSIHAYYKNGHFISGRTWFKNCKRLGPSTCLRIDLKNESILSSEYWNWSEVEKSSQSRNELIIAYYNSFASLFQEIECNDHSVGIGLSGGLDSRWVAYEFSKFPNKVETYTFSKGKSIDLAIAKKVSHELNFNHYTYCIAKSDWFKERLRQFWDCDGLIPIYHFHEGDIYSQWREKYDLIATGFYGGGIYSAGKLLNQKVNSQLAEKFFKFGNIPFNANDTHYDISSLDPYLSWQKIAQCGAIQVYTMTKSIKVFIPFYNMNWMKINYSIDEKWQEYSKFYLEVLNQYLPGKLMKLLWQRTLFFSNRINLNILIQKLSINRIIKKILRTFGYESNFVDYRMLNSEIEKLEQSLDIPGFVKNFEPHSIDEKVRKASILLWYNMWNKKSSDVI